MIVIKIAGVENIDGDIYFFIYSDHARKEFCIIGKAEYNQDFYRKCQSLGLYDDKYHHITFDTYQNLLNDFICITNFPVQDIDDLNSEQLYLFTQGEKDEKKHSDGSKMGE